MTFSFRASAIFPIIHSNKKSIPEKKALLLEGNIRIEEVLKEFCCCFLSIAVCRRILQT
jgi:hypothetical protein